MQKSAREALDLSLKDHLVVVDEAHNLIDTISSIHSVSTSLSQLRKCRSSLGIYLSKYRNRLKGKNRVYVSQLVRLLDSFSQYLEKRAAEKAGSDGLVSINELMKGKGVDQINLHKLLTYLQQSKLARKVEGYIQYEEQARKEQPVREGGQAFIPTLTNVLSFSPARCCLMIILSLV